MERIEKLEVELDSFKASIRARNAVYRIGSKKIESLSDLENISDTEILCIERVGLGTLRELRSMQREIASQKEVRSISVDESISQNMRVVSLFVRSKESTNPISTGQMANLLKQLEIATLRHIVESLSDISKMMKEK